MLNIFDKSYKACSNLIIEDIEGNKYIYPSPLEIHATIENESKNTKNEISFKFTSYYDSIIVIKSYFKLFFITLDFEFGLTSFYFKSIIQKENSNDMSGHKVMYIFNNDDLILNIANNLDNNIYNEYTKIKQKTIL
jgi:hypothetical protein